MADEHEVRREVAQLAGSLVSTIEAKLTQAEGTITTYIGIYFGGEKCWQITCPCGVTVEYPVNGLPEVDTPHPCGNPNHWSVKWEGGAK